MEVLYPRCAGLDVHKDVVVACVRCMAGEASDERSRSVRRDNDGGTRVKGDRRNTGSPQRWAMALNRRPARVGPGCWGWRTGPYDR